MKMVEEITHHIIELDADTIKLKHGEISLELETNGWSKNYESNTSWSVQYNRPEFSYFKYKDAPSLKEAIDQYLKWDLNARGM